MDVSIRSAGGEGASPKREAGVIDASKVTPNGLVAAETNSALHVTKKEVEKSVETLSAMLDPHLTRLKFNVHEDTDRVYVQVIDRETEEVVREIPPESLLDLNASILRQAGLLVNEKG